MIIEFRVSLRSADELYKEAKNRNPCQSQCAIDLGLTAIVHVCCHCVT